ncbi:hypothetical protein D3P08_06195 [Paenibacillus nanensis]|uniref:Dockerin domain-containing protein n=1 Tax=Paenibacillus nanensis TaxID=393251 RepID=A0A3A1VHC7_9BACL|nr:family 43 glycosylhydrolase [Paenibacillus nanensis]RIX59714.1 hypothetical protein D3P08_06195 [Paenibacillus nanensis]
MRSVFGTVMAFLLLVGVAAVPVKAHAADPAAEGQGLLGEFYRCVPNPNNREDINVFKFDDFRGERTVSQLNGDSFTSLFNQMTGSPDYNTARFTGTIVPKYSEEYIFHMVGDDGFRLWLDGELIIDFWQQKWEIEQSSAPIWLEAGKHYDVKIEYLQGWGGAWLRMEWESASQQREIVPESALYLPAERTLAAKKEDLNGEVQKAEYLISSFTDQVSENDAARLNEVKASAEQLLSSMDGMEIDDREKAVLASEMIQTVSDARSAFMKQLGATSPTVHKKFNNPLYQGQDPFVTYKDGFYYFVSSSNLDSNNKVYVSKSRTLVDQGEKVMVFDSKGTQTRIFAPEIFFLDGRWYIYYCADLKEYGYRHMATVLESVSDDPQGEYVSKGAIYTGVNGEYREANDFTVFELNGQLYGVWGTLGPGEPAGPAIAPMDNPYTISADRTILRNGGGEGPRVLQRDGKIFITVSEGDYASNGYRLSYFMNTDGDVLNPDSWTRQNDVFTSTSDVSGPARAGFVKSADGTEDWMIYHSRVYKDTERNWWRQVHIKKFGWNEDGTPNFGKPVSPYEWQQLPSGDLGLGVMYQAEDAILYGDITVENRYANHQGSGYIHLPETVGAEASFVVEAETAGDYIVGLRYAYGVQVNGESTNHPTTQLPSRAKINVYVNGAHVKTIAPDKTAISWEEWFTASERLTLSSGKNVISYRIDNGSIGNVNVDFMSMYKADVPNDAEPAALAAILTGPQQTAAGSAFGATYGLAQVPSSPEEAIYAQDLVFHYDPSKLQFISVESLMEGLVVIDSRTDIVGQVRILVVSEGAGHAVAADGDLLKLHWKALQPVSQTAITLSQALLANADGAETALPPVSLPIEIRTAAAPGDTNSDGKVSVGDLALVAASYGKDSTSPDWNAVKKYDMNQDGVIDIADLAFIARTILQ